MSRCLFCGEHKEEKDGLSAVLFGDDVLCEPCRRSLKIVRKRIMLEKQRVLVLYRYDEAFSSMLIQYKECFDEALAPLFLSPWANSLHRLYRGYALVLIPSSKLKQNRRGFNFLLKMAMPLHLPVSECLIKCGDTEQKRQSAAQRRMIGEQLRLDPAQPIPKKIVLLDDVVTTGSTMRAAISLLRPHVEKMEVLAVSASASLLSK